MKLNEHRKSIVRALLLGSSHMGALASKGAKQIQLAFHDDSDASLEAKQHPQRDTCVATGMFFPDKLSQMQITISNVGALWMGLWLDSKLVLHDGCNEISRKLAGMSLSGIPELDSDIFHGNTLFPRWLAEVLNEFCSLGIQECDIYDEEE